MDKFTVPIIDITAADARAARRNADVARSWHDGSVTARDSAKHDCHGHWKADGLLRKQQEILQSLRKEINRLKQKVAAAKQGLPAEDQVTAERIALSRVAAAELRPRPNPVDAKRA